MATATYSSVIQIGSINVNRTRTYTTDAEISVNPSLVVAQAGSLTTRTDNDTGTITMSSGGHTIATGNTVDVYWDGGVQYGVTVGTVSGTAVPIDLGSGDNLPAQDTAVTVVVQQAVTCNIDGDNASLVVFYLVPSSDSDTTVAHLDMVDSGGSTILELDLVAGVPRIYDIAAGDSNALTGNPITSIKASQAGTDAARVVKIAAVYDSTP